MRDLEETAWGVFDLVGDDDVVNKLKALELLVKIRLGGERVKPKGEDAPASSREMTSQILRDMNRRLGT